MNIFYEEHRNILKQLIYFKIDFLIIGGYAVNLYGYVRATGDMDIWLRPDNKTRDLFTELLINENFSEETIEDLRKLDFTVPQMVFYGERPSRIDFLTQISGVSFDEAYGRKNNVEINEINLPFISLEDLILSKLTTGRLRDKSDIEQIQKVQKLNQKN